MPRLKIESVLIKQAQEGVDPVEKNAAENLKNLLLVRVIIFLLYYIIIYYLVFCFDEAHVGCSECKMISVG